MQATIRKIRILHKIDEDPDLSFYGEYTSERPSEAELHRGDAFDRKYRPYWNPRTHRYFLCEWTVEFHRKNFHQMGYSKGVAEEMARAANRADFNRMEDYNRDGWCCIGIVAEAEVQYPVGLGHHRIEWLTSGGVWGIESDCEKTIKEEEESQLDILKNHLQVFNVDLSNWDDMVEHCERKE
jgi:hypothetical protein